MTTLALILVVFVVLALFLWRAVNRHLSAGDQFQELPPVQGNGLTPTGDAPGIHFDLRSEDLPLVLYPPQCQKCGGLPGDVSCPHYPLRRRRQRRARHNRRRSAGGWSGEVAL